MWPWLKKQAWNWRVVLIATPALAGTVIALRLLGALQVGEWFFYDQFMRLRPDLAQDDRIAIVGVDEGDYRLLQMGQLPDGVLADAIAAIQAQNPRAIGLDFYRNLPVEPGHDRLLEVFANSPNLVGIRKVVGESDRETVSGSETLSALNQLGSNDILVDGDSRVRRGLIAVGDSTGEWVASFSVLLADLYLSEEDKGANFIPVGESDWHLQFGDVTLPEFQANDGGYIGADAGGKQILINYRAGSHTFELVSLRQVLQGQLPPDWAKDRIILIGPYSEADKDYFYVPHSSALVGESTPMYGVEIHAQLTSQILSAVLDDRPFLGTWPEWGENLWILAWSGVGATSAWLLRRGNSSSPLHLLKHLGSNLFLVGALVGGSFWFFTENYWIPVLPPLLAGMVSSLTVVGYVAQSAGSIRKTFGRYLSAEIVETLLESPEGLKMGGERRKITILTSDLRGFTATAERLPPEEVIRILNFYLGHMADIITHYRGTIDEFMGDGILVLFGAPTTYGDEAERSVACAIAMQQIMETVNVQMEEWGYSDLDMGIGINTGEVVVGNIGSVKRTKYGVVGSQVNLTYRIESYTTGGQVLLSETTYQELQAAKANLKILGTKEVQPKGVKRPILIYDVAGIGAPYDLVLRRDAEVYQELTTPSAIRYAVLSGKHVDDRLYPAHLISLSRKQALVKLDLGFNRPPELEPLVNLKINLVDPDTTAMDGPTPGSTPTLSPGDPSHDANLGNVSIYTEDIYAKVLEDSAPEGCIYLYFTAKPPIVAQYLNQLSRRVPD